ncbi:restriction endonuclease subunit S [Photobacterium damselae]|uniref:restriction endonuclease subunit S n=1 Tax=Photobacterium damselae TaxID=38293 RepID=UPI001EDEF409|nr:restriction endonuclease subunit S [Photobacterium damselae]MCG3845627.1 restriction endonuclease subunit S [Photobacterium damselae]
MSHLTSYDNNQYSDYFQTTLPSHWKEKRLNYIAEQNRNSFVDGPFGSDLKTSDYKDAGIPLIQLNNIRDGQHILRNIKFITAEKKDELARHIALPNDVVIAKMADPVARAAIVSDRYSEFVIVADCVKFTPDLNLIDLHYLIWAINCDCVRINAELVSTGTTRIRINLSELKKLKIPYPPLQEQTQIAAFLDHETAKIDTLIEKQQQLIELLKEKRQAVISHAVTKGLNPDAPMKDSGVEWLGEVPEHWEILPTKRLFKLVAEPSEKNNNHELLSVYTAIGVAPRKELEQKGNKASSTDGYWLVQKGDIIVNKLLAWMGAVGYSNYDGVTSPAYDILRKIKDINPKFYHYLFRQEFTQQEFKRWSRGIMEMRLRLYFEELGRIFMPVPPINEQNKIVQEIEMLESKYEDIESNATKQIKLLQERRTALISAAVTGKIDVRNWVAPATSSDINEVQQEATA